MSTSRRLDFDIKDFLIEDFVTKGERGSKNHFFRDVINEWLF